ncbi:hypothetical protein KIW84_065471 [Lathyrus oleraceus]|uniref:DUF7745 domain-containing protein n=1 Tax=Pisum sativum TaxID=3888 RepID=A0A9D4WFI0_PEA|nr:hypothetical protein KIW84_065471 [Pisum sativum]
MDFGRRNTKKYNFRCPDLKELRKLASFVLDPLDFKKHHRKILSILSADVVEGLLSVLVQFYDPLYRCFTFPDYQLWVGIDPRSHLIVEAPHLKKSEIKAHWVKKGGLFGLPSDFHIKEAIAFAQAGSVDAFEAIFVLLIYGLALSPNIDGFIDVNAIRLFLIRNHVPTLLGDMYFSLHLRNSKVWYDPSLSSLEIIDCCGEFSNVPFIGTQGGTDYNLALAHRQLRFPLRNKPNNALLEDIFYQEALEAYTLWVKKRALELKMPYPCERPMSKVVVEPLTLPNQDVEELEDALAKMKREKDMWEERLHALSKKHEELQLESKDKDALIELLEDRVTKIQREPEVSSSSMPQPSIAWKKIVDQLVLEKTQMKPSSKTEIRRIQRKYTPAAKSSDVVVRHP